MKVRNNRIYRTFTALAATLCLAGFVSAQSGDGLEPFRFNPFILVGTWNAEAQIINCQSGAVMQTFSKLVSFDHSGTAHETSTGAPPALRTTAFGAWRFRGYRSGSEYGLRFFRYNPDGTLAGSTRARWVVSMTGQDEYSAQAQIQIVAPNGVVVNNLCGVETATRFVIEL
jgi:hypothetical protein